MISETLREARDYEKIHGEKVKKEERPLFHLSPRTGWMNDPNGFSYYKGKYHIFHQYYPYDCHWGNMHWAHAVSDDLLHWEYLPAALAPDESYDKNGCFSGSAAELPDGRHLLMYTGVLQEQHEDGTISDIQTQCLAVGDGENYEKYEQNPVLTEKNLPEGSSKSDFRDPKIWKGEDGLYYCVVGSRPADGSGQILLYTSIDGFEWKYKNILASNKNRYGKMWECPDFFELDGKWVLLTSPQDMQADGLEYHNGHGTMCMVGEFDSAEGTFSEEVDQAIDYGTDFYAPQTMQAPDGRRIMIGWMQNWETKDFRMENQPWFGQMSLPRELSIRNNRLYQKPIKELEGRRCNEVRYLDVEVTDELRLDGVKGRMVDVEFTIRPEDGQEMYEKFAVRFARGGRFYTELSFTTADAVLKVDRSFSGTRKDSIHQRCCQTGSVKGILKVRMILDWFSAEIFINDGEQVMTTVLYTDQASEGISFSAKGSVKMDLVKYDLLG